MATAPSPIVRGSADDEQRQNQQFFPWPDTTWKCITSSVSSSDGEIPEAPRGSGIDTAEGFRQRTSWLAGLDLHADYAIPISEHRVLLLADVFNVFNRRAPLDYDNYTEAAFGVPNPDFGRVIEYQDLITARFGVRFDF